MIDNGYLTVKVKHDVTPNVIPSQDHRKPCECWQVVPKEERPVLLKEKGLQQSEVDRAIIFQS